MQHTLGLSTEQWCVLDQAHAKRNRAEHEGDADLDVAVVDTVIRVVREVQVRVTGLARGDD